MPLAMIHYMPFTYIPEPLVTTLAAVFGSFAVCQPLKSLVPEHMRRAAEHGSLRLYPPDAADPETLERALKAFNAWAGMHRGRPGDLAAFFSSESGQGAPGQESAQRIRSQILTAESGQAQQSPLIQEALFLCLAHQYDQQQDAVRRDIASVASLEHRFGQILGEAEEDAGSLGPDLATGRDAASIDPGLYMTERRIDSWARLARGGQGPEAVYITTSRSVWESLCERLPDAAPVLRGHSGSLNDPAGFPDRWAAFFSELSQAQDPFAVAGNLPEPNALRGPRWVLTVQVLADCPPDRFLSRLQTHEPMVPGPADSMRLNTVLAYLQVDADSFEKQPMV
jgi:hypothetical protein